jgi:cation:H+ antiporter
MPVSLAVLQIAGGILYLLMGGDLLVRGAMALSHRTRFSPMVIGLTVVALGTSAPELVVTLSAALGAYPEIAAANVVGSNIANVLLVMAVPALLFPLAFDKTSARSHSVFMLLVSVLFFVLCWDEQLSRADGLVLLAGLVLFLALRAGTKLDVEEEPVAPTLLPSVLGLPARRWSLALVIVVRAVMLPLEAGLLLDGGVGLGEMIGISNEVIGLTLIALSTSLPELATTMVAVYKRQSSLAVGNLIGSNILNVLGIMGIASTVRPRELAVRAQFMTFDLPLMLTAATIVTGLAFRRGTVGKRLAGLMFGMYVVYTYLLYTGGS